MLITLPYAVLLGCPLCLERFPATTAYEFYFSIHIYGSLLYLWYHKLIGRYWNPILWPVTALTLIARRQFLDVGFATMCLVVALASGAFDKVDC
jgi:hypothetical protein